MATDRCPGQCLDQAEHTGGQEADRRQRRMRLTEPELMGGAQPPDVDKRPQPQRQDQDEQQGDWPEDRAGGHHQG